MRVSKKALATGQPLVVTVVGDDLAKANTLEDATRFGVGADAVETSAQFAPVAGAVVHVGTATYVSDAERRRDRRVAADPGRLGSGPNATWTRRSPTSARRRVS